MILGLTRSHCTSHEIPGCWALLLATSETDEHLFFPLGIYYIWSSCLQMKIFWLLQPKGNVHLSPPQDLDTRSKFQLLGQWVREWYINIRMIAVMQKHDEFQHCFRESLHPYWNWRWRRRRHWISAFFFIAACLWFLLPNFVNQFFFLPSGMVTSVSHVLLEKLLSSLLDPKFPLQSFCCEEFSSCTVLGTSCAS